MSKIVHWTLWPKIAISYKEHIRCIKYTNSKSAYANHILQNNHEYGPIEQSMELLKKENKGRKMNTWENYCIQKINILFRKTVLP
jgi:hypothetical protein